METINVQIRKIAGNEDLPLPEYMTRLAAGMDLFAAVAAEETILPGARKKIPTGIVISLPEGYEAQIRPRSGLALKHGITLLNTPGTVDSDYRGEVKIIVANLGAEAFTVEHGMRIAQMVFARVCRGSFIEAEGLTESGRSDGGFGHSGL